MFWRIIICCLWAPLSAVAQPNMLHTVKVVLFPYQKAIISAKVASFIQEYRVQEGQSFRQGDLLVLLDRSYYQENYRRYQALVQEARNRLDFANKIFTQGQQLYQQNNLGAFELAKRSYDVKQAQVKYTKAMIDLDLAKLDLQACCIRAPFSGRLLKKHVQTYEWISQGHELLTIIDDSRLLALMHLPAPQINKTKIGQPLSIRIDQTNTRHRVIIQEIAAVIDPRSRTFEIKALLENPTRKLRVGMTGILLYEKGNQ